MCESIACVLLDLITARGPGWCRWQCACWGPDVLAWYCTAVSTSSCSPPPDWVQEGQQEAIEEYFILDGGVNG